MWDFETPNQSKIKMWDFETPNLSKIKICEILRHPIKVS